MRFLMKGIGKIYADLLINIVMSTSAMLSCMDEDYFTSKEEKRQWNKKQIIGHLIDSAYFNHLRILHTITYQNMIFTSYDQDLCVRENQYEIRASQEVLETFIVVQRHFANLIAGLEDSVITAKYERHQLDLTAMQHHDKEHAANLSFLIWDYIFHLEHHFAQIIPGYKTVCPTEYY
jgi:hypothetical protein